MPFGYRVIFFKRGFKQGVEEDVETENFLTFVEKQFRAIKGFKQTIM